MQQHLKPLLFCVLHILHLRATQPPNPENLNLVQARAYVISLRSRLKKQPLVLQRDDGLHKIGGKEQCSQECLRKILARMRNWVQLVKEVIRAELPFFEVFHNLSTLLELEDDPIDLGEAAATVGRVLEYQL